MQSEPEAEAEPWPARVLLACDGSEQAARASAVVAALVSPQAVVRLLTVAGSEYAPYEGQWGPLSDAEDRKFELALIMDQAFTGPLERLRPTGCRLEAGSRLGNPGQQILIDVEEWNPDLVVVGRTGAGGMVKLVLGSVSNHVVKNARVPVLVVS